MNIEKKTKRNPRETANFLSLFTFWYILDLIKKGYRKDLSEDDLYDVTKHCESKSCGDKLEKYYLNVEEKENYPVLLKVILKILGWRYFLCGATQLAAELMKRIIQPNAVAKLVYYFSPGQTEMTKYDAFFNAGLVLFCDFFDKIYFSNLDLYLVLLGVEIRTCICSCLFRKVLRMSPATVSQGNIVTLITKDVQQIKRTMFILSDICVFTVVVTVTCFLLYLRIGPTSLVATGVFICAMPLNVIVAKLINKLRMQTCEKTDERLQITQEVLTAIKIIKMYALEEIFERKINLSRRKEVAKLLLVFYLRMVLLLTGAIVSKVGLYLLIMAYIWMEQPTHTSTIFFITIHFESLRIYFGNILPESFGKIAEFSSAMSRISRVLIGEEIDNIKDKSKRQFIEPSVKLEEVTLSIADNEILKNVDLCATSGLTLITGRVGSGKSCLLKTILQEYKLKNGKVEIAGNISYASQNPWLFPSTIKQNILFGEKYDEKRYQEVLRVCALQLDLTLFEKGDETILTDNGQNLSNGQQARINLARAIYKKSDIYLLDDCLSALDTHVYNFIFNQCVKGFLKDNICIMVTQDKNRLKIEEKAYLLSHGRIKNYLSPRKKSLHDMQLLKDSILENENEPSSTDENFKSLETDKLLETEQTVQKNIYQEELKKGAVDKAVYMKYVAFGGGVLILLLNLLLIGFNQASESYSEKLISVWTDEKQLVLNIKNNISKSNENDSSLSSQLENAEVEAGSIFKLYTIMLTVSVILEIIRTYTFLDFCRRASVNIHKAMVKNVLQSVMAFFDTHFIGNILNRFSQDVINVDENLPFQLNACLSTLFRVGGTLVILVSLNPYFSIYAIGFFCAMVCFLRFYLPVARNLQRLEASTRSPMLGHLNAALEGITTIRAYNAEQMVIREYEKYQNVFTSAHYSLLSYQFAFGFYMNLLASVMITIVVISFVIFDAGMSAGSVGLAITEVMNLGSMIQQTVKTWADLENLMTATERALEYTSIETESKVGTVIENWPNKGEVKYDNVFLTYNKNDIILNKINFDIGSQEKIGVVGRTGAGKSSIISTLFRLYGVEGKILIDNIDIKTISLKYLRTNIAIIPQDPILFSGTLRFNLDPFGKFNDTDLWTALEKSNLKHFVTKLDMEIKAGASNFSLGQKQMICVARAILAKAKIVVLDEATANMDRETENLIHNTINVNFSECTVITIAHRLQSILKCDKVMVLDRGEIKEFDGPDKLLANKIGDFSKMIGQSDMSA